MLTGSTNTRCQHPVVRSRFSTSCDELSPTNTANNIRSDQGVGLVFALTQSSSASGPKFGPQGEDNSRVFTAEAAIASTDSDLATHGMAWVNVSGREAWADTIRQAHEGEKT